MFEIAGFYQIQCQLLLLYLASFLYQAYLLSAISLTKTLIKPQQPGLPRQIWRKEDYYQKQATIVGCVYCLGLSYAQ